MKQMIVYQINPTILMIGISPDDVACVMRQLMLFHEQLKQVLQEQPNNQHNKTTKQSNNEHNKTTKQSNNEHNKNKAKLTPMEWRAAGNDSMGGMAGSSGDMGGMAGSIGDMGGIGSADIVSEFIREEIDVVCNAAAKLIQAWWCVKRSYQA